MVSRLLQDENIVKNLNVKCPGGEMSNSYYSCSTINICPVGFVRCEDGSCAEKLSKCLHVKCQEGLLKCWDGKCVKN